MNFNSSHCLPESIIQQNYENFKKVEFEIIPVIAKLCIHCLQAVFRIVTMIEVLSFTDDESKAVVVKMEKEKSDFHEASKRRNQNLRINPINFQG